MSDNGMRAALTTVSGLCHEEVIRKGFLEPCDKTAVALRYQPGSFEPYPVCAYHSRGDMVPLADIVAFVMPINWKVKNNEHR